MLNGNHVASTGVPSNPALQDHDPILFYPSKDLCVCRKHRVLKNLADPEDFFDYSCPLSPREDQPAHLCFRKPKKAAGFQMPFADDQAEDWDCLFADRTEDTRKQPWTPADAESRDDRIHFCPCKADHLNPSRFDGFGFSGPGKWGLFDHHPAGEMGC